MVIGRIFSGIRRGLAKTAGVFTGVAPILRGMRALFLVGALFVFAAALVATRAFGEPLADRLVGVSPTAFAACPSMR